MRRESLHIRSDAAWALYETVGHPLNHTYFGRLRQAGTPVLLPTEQDADDNKMCTTFIIMPYREPGNIIHLSFE